MRKYWYAAAVAVTAMFTAVMMAGTASAATAVLHYADGTAVANRTTLVGSGTASFTTAPGGSSGVFCDTSYQATVTDNSGNPATESLDQQTFTNCVPQGVFCLTAVNSVNVDNLSYSTSVDSTGKTTVSPGTRGPVQTTVDVSSCLGGFTCVYQAHNGSLTGTAVNADNSLNFTDQQFDLVSGPSAVCFDPAYFSAKYSPNTDGAGNPVYVG